MDCLAVERSTFSSGDSTFGPFFVETLRPESRSWDQCGAKMGPKIEKMLWKKTSVNRCRKSVENHGKMAQELWPNAW